MEVGFGMDVITTCLVPEQYASGMGKFGRRQVGGVCSAICFYGLLGWVQAHTSFMRAYMWLLGGCNSLSCHGFCKVSALGGVRGPW